MLDIDIALQRGSFSLAITLTISAPVSGVFGPSGSGKTTLLHCLAGLVKPDRGHIRLFGEPLFDAATRHFTAPHQRHIGVVFQDAQLFPHLSVRNNLLYGYRRLRPGQRQFQPEPIIELLAIGHLLEQRPRQLSGGEKQRVALGRALLFSPRLLLLDEPLSALDQPLKRQILPFLRRIRDELQIPMLYVSHALDEILYLTPTLALIEQGRLLGHGHYLDVLAQSEQPASTWNIDPYNIWPARIIENHVQQGYSSIAVADSVLILPPASASVGDTVTIAVRATQIALTRQRIDAITIQNQLAGQIVRFVEHRHGWLAEVDIGVPLVAEISAKAVADLQLAVGDSVICLIKAHSFEYPDLPG